MSKQEGVKDLSIYCIQGLERGGESSTYFKEKGLHGFGPTTVTESGIYIFPKTAVTVSLLLLVNLIHDFFYACFENKAFIEKSHMRKVIQYIEVPVSGPILELNKLSTGYDKEAIRGIGMVDSNDNASGKYVGSPSFSATKSLYQEHGVPIDQRTNMGNVNIAGMMAFYYAWKCVGIFIMTFGERYPGVVEGEMKVLCDDEAKPFGGEENKGKTTGMGYSEFDTDILEGEDVDMTGKTTYLLSQMRPLMELIRVSTGISFTHWTSTIGNALNNVSSAHVFPYFEDMLLPSPDFVATVIFRYFSKCLCDSAEEAMDLFPALRLGFRSLYRTSKGKELQHVLFGVQCAIESGGRLRILVDGGVYKGFLLIGDMLVLYRSSMRQPLRGNELSSMVNRLDSHGNACRNIKEILDDMVVLSNGSETKEEVDLDLLLTRPRYLHAECVKRNIPANEEKFHELDLYIRYLTYGIKYWEVTTENMLIVLQAMITGLWRFPEAPMAFGRDIWKSTNVLLIALSVFGEKAPSIVNGSQVFTIPRDGRNDPNLVLMENGKRTLQYIPYQMKGLVSCAIDWNLVRSKRQLRVPPAKKGKNGFADMSKMDGSFSQDFNRIYPKIKELCDVSEIVETSTSTVDKGKKRAAEENRSGSTSKKINF